MGTKVYIRVDGSPEIGLGHVIRCIALAHMLKNDFDITFVCKEIPKKIKQELKYLFNFLSINKEISFLELLELNDIVIIDGYHFDSKYQKRIKEREVKLVCIDDLHDKEYHADLIINHAPATEPGDYKAQSYTRFALGTKYALLRPDFLKQASKPRFLDNKILLICFGGSDIKNLTVTSLKVALQFSEFKKILVVTGHAYDFIDSLNSIIAKNERVIHYHALNQKQMLSAMLEAGVFIVPASGILLEALVVGGKVVSGIYADNQKILYERFKEAKAFFDAGHFKPKTLKLALQSAIFEDDKTFNIYDGKSANRILACFYELITYIRTVSKHDCDLLFKWANNREVRQNAFSKEAIEWENHTKWFDSKIHSAYSKIYILEIKGIPIGQIRYDYDKQKDYWIIGYSIDSRYRGMGFGKIILKKTLCYFKYENINAVVKRENIASAKVFLSLGFKEVRTEQINNELYKTYELSL